jgi:hypothetical protein
VDERLFELLRKLSFVVGECASTSHNPLNSMFVWNSTSEGENTCLSIDGEPGSVLAALLDKAAAMLPLAIVGSSAMRSAYCLEKNTPIAAVLKSFQTAEIKPQRVL